MSNSTDKMDVRITDSPWGKRWVKVTLKNSNSFYPSFEDLHRIIQAIAHCEGKKYPNGRGREMVADFLCDCVTEQKFEYLAAKYKIPLRDGKEIKNPNGAFVNKIRRFCGL